MKDKHFKITCELAPPKGPDCKDLIKYAHSIKDLVDGINITDGQGANLRMSSVVAAHLVQRETGTRAICQMVCRDRNQLGLQADILGAYGLNINNFLLLTGDKVAAGDHPQAKDVFDFSTDDLLKAFKNMQEGLDFAGNKLNAPLTNLTLGATAHPGLPDLAGQAVKMKARAEQGIQFFQTQIVYEQEQIKRFLDSITDIKVPVLIGVTPLKSVQMANFMNEKLYGVQVPASLIEKLEKASDPSSEGLKLTLELVHQAKELGASGFHLMAIGQNQQLPNILQEINKIN